MCVNVCAVDLCCTRWLGSLQPGIPKIAYSHSTPLITCYSPLWKKWINRTALVCVTYFKVFLWGMWYENSNTVNTMELINNKMQDPVTVSRRRCCRLFPLFVEEHDY